jgi:hypothetical protein
MARLRYVAANVGEREVLTGIERFQVAREKTSFPFISANLVYQDTAQPITEPFILHTAEVGAAGGKKRKVRVGIFGLVRMNTGLAVTTPDGRRIVTGDPIAAARKIVPGILKKADLVVALVTLEPDQARALARELPGIHLILGGFGAMLTPTQDVAGDTKVGESRILYAGNQGKKIGEVRIFLAEKNRPEKLERDLVGLGRRIPDDPDLMDLVDRNRIAINEIHKAAAPLVDAARIREMYEGKSYVQAESCKDCHEEEYRLWKQSRHAHAFQTLVDRHQDYNPECVGCHVTGFRRPTGFLNAKSTPEMMDVQCEACHGPGKGHPDSVGKGYGRVGRAFCVSCHTTDNSPDFDPIAYMVKIRHWKESAGGPAAAAGR